MLRHIQRQTMSLKEATVSNMGDRGCSKTLQELTMKLHMLILLTVLVWLTALSANAETSVYELTLKGKQCQETSSQALGCEYRIGKTLHISIDGIGQTDTGITFMKSDYDGDFYASVGVLHGCVIVKRNPKLSDRQNAFDFAFVSPRTGKVYRTWQACGAGP